MSARPQCTGTDCAEQCRHGQCYWEEMMMLQEREKREREEWERGQMEEHFRKHPHG